MDQHRSFGTGTKRKVTFDIDGETFNCHSNLHYKALRAFIEEFAGLADIPQGGTPTKEQVNSLLLGIDRFFDETMPTDERERFRQFVDDPARQVELGTLSSICEYLIEVYGGARPTLPSSPSGDGRSNTTATSTDESPSPAGTSTPPLQTVP